MSRILPLKFNVFKCFADARGESLSNKDVYKALEPIYGGEKQFTMENVQALLDSLLAVDMIEDVNVEYGEGDELIIYYKMGQIGKDRVRHIPR